MGYLIPILITSVIIILVAIIIVANLKKKWKMWDPTLWDQEIKRFERNDKKNFPEQNLILFIGSSSIRLWKSLQEDMAPLKVLNRGFGGARIPDIIHYYPKIVSPYNPKAIVFYAGDNDLSSKMVIFNGIPHDPETVKDNFQKFCEKTHSEFPDIPIFYISMKPPKGRISLIKEINKANELLKEFCATKPTYHFIDICPILMDGDKLKDDIYRRDKLHLNKKGYDLIVSVIKPILLENLR